MKNIKILKIQFQTSADSEASRTIIRRNRTVDEFWALGWSSSLNKNGNGIKNHPPVELPINIRYLSDRGDRYFGTLTRDRYFLSKFVLFYKSQSLIWRKHYKKQKAEAFLRLILLCSWLIWELFNYILEILNQTSNLLRPMNLKNSKYSISLKSFILKIRKMSFRTITYTEIWIIWDLSIENDASIEWISWISFLIDKSQTHQCFWSFIMLMKFSFFYFTIP